MATASYYALIGFATLNPIQTLINDVLEVLSVFRVRISARVLGLGSGLGLGF